METEKSDCWKVYAAITDHYRPNMERLRDWISIPKANGYEALHTTVMSHTGQWVEIQIRSRRMDDIAEKGYAAHWKYKESMSLNSQLDNWLDRIKEMIESPDANALSFIDDVKGYFFLDEISVFTPQGELRTLPANSTVLDFAYAIHSELGDTCIGAKIDKKLAPINQVLKNGQQVELITSRKQSPKEEWIQYVVTTRAKSHIKLVVRDEKKRYTRQGKEKLCQWFHQTGIDCTHENTVKFQSAYHYNTLVDLYYDVARDRLGIKDIRLFAANNLRDGWISFINKNNTKKNRKAVAANNLREATVPHEDFRQQDSLILVQPDFTVASCCNPIPGDEVIGLKISENLPVQIHRTKCPTAQEQISMFGNQPLKLDWTSQTSISYLTHIKVSGMDRIGLISEITRIISSELSLNIQSFHIDAQNGLTQGEINLYVQDTSVLRDCLLKIKNVEGIVKVTRID
jgi:GTP pyrophosphokinase